MNEFAPAADAAETPEPIARVLRLETIPGGKPDLDEMAREAGAHAEARNTPLMLRMQPDLYFQGDGEGKHRYKPWPGVTWKAEFPSAEEIIAFRHALNTFVMNYFLQHGGATILAEGSVTSPVNPTEETGA